MIFSMQPLLFVFLFFLLRKASALPKPNGFDNSKNEALVAIVNALEVMQSQFWNGNTWLGGIVWTDAVYNTIEWSTLNAMSRYGGESMSSLVNQYYTQLLNFYTGEDVTEAMNEKYDDMQWVVLEWLEAIKFMTVYKRTDGGPYVAEFAKRARTFWDVASQGYNTTLCGGGMVWTYTLLPYKNAITNELFVASSVGMYLYFPGDNSTTPPAMANDPKYLNAAVEEYKWLNTSGMTNSQGLYVDGFHIAGYVSPSNPGTGKCDQRDEDVYSYNQGVVLSGLRGLWDATGQESYLDDGHTLVSNVIAATGWVSTTKQNAKWSGLGSNGILQDLCETTNSCGEDAQNFKGVFFSHFTAFCEPLAVGEQEGIIFKATTAQAQAHQKKCSGYKDWIKHNAEAAYGTRNSAGVYGGIWNVPAGGADPNSVGRGRTPETQSGGLAVMLSLVQAQESSS